MIGVTGQSVSQWENGSTKSLEGENLYRLAKALNVSAEWLLTGHGEALSNIEEGPRIRGHVPLISWVQAGDWCEISDQFNPGEADCWFPCPRAHSRHTFALRVRGVSMEPKYQDGDIIFVDPEAPAEHGKNIVVRLEDEQEATFKQLVIEGNQRFLKAINPDWPAPKLIPVNSSATICGVVIGKWVAE